MLLLLVGATVLRIAHRKWPRHFISTEIVCPEHEPGYLLNTLALIITHVHVRCVCVCVFRRKRERDDDDDGNAAAAADDVVAVCC